MSGAQRLRAKNAMGVSSADVTHSLDARENGGVQYEGEKKSAHSSVDLCRNQALSFVFDLSRRWRRSSRGCKAMLASEALADCQRHEDNLRCCLSRVLALFVVQLQM